MIILGIESTAHTFGVGIVDAKNKKVLSNIKKGFTTDEGGMIPSEVAEHHMNNADSIIINALNEANVKFADIDLISFSRGPGIGHMLRIGATVARTLSLKLNKPLVGVNHCIAHLEIGQMLFESCKDPVLLYASGANTQIIAYEGGKYRIFGETLDIGVGNFLDSLARELGLGFPGGPKVYELALEGKNLIELPYVVKGMDVSFGGLLTNLKQKIKSGKYKKEDLCFSAQETVFAMLLEVSERALAHCKKNELLLGGGVACNIRLQDMAFSMTKERKSLCFIPPNDLLLDNGAMIAWLGFLMYNSDKVLGVDDSGILPYERTDTLDVDWK